MKYFVLFYIKLYSLLKDSFRIKIKGLGKVQKFLKNDFVFTAFEKKFYYKNTIEGSYDLLLIGKSNEPETHILFERIFPKLPAATFIDVGGSIGEFVNLASTYDSVNRIIAFEPRPDCADVLRKNAELNNDKRIIIHEIALSDEKGQITFNLNAGGSSSSILNKMNHEENDSKITVKTDLLDDCLNLNKTTTVILIDVEGAELNVLRGGKKFIEKNRPLIIFEYNNTSKKFFHLKDVKNLLGEGYEIRRVRTDGELDIDFDHSWNCVAIPSNSIFSNILLDN